MERKIHSQIFYRRSAPMEHIAASSLGDGWSVEKIDDVVVFR